jgi:quercetin dioxygenase-like cupin family protein
MMKTTPMVFGILDGNVYDFERAGDELGPHAHDEDTNHISIVARGSFKAWGGDWEVTLPVGAVVDWPVRQTHAFTALEDNSRLVNIKKGV